MLNISNHNSKNWSNDQIEAALKMSGWDKIVDIEFPNVNPTWGTFEVKCAAASVVYAANKIVEKNSKVAHVMGEMGMTMELVRRLQKDGWTVVHSTTERITETGKDGSITKLFVFKQFRIYSNGGLVHTYATPCIRMRYWFEGDDAFEYEVQNLCTRTGRPCINGAFDDGDGAGIDCDKFGPYSPNSGWCIHFQ